MKKERKIVTTLLKNYYRDMGIIALYKRQLELLLYGLTKQVSDDEKKKIENKIVSLNTKVKQLEFKNCQLDLIVNSIKEENSINADILDMKFKKNYLITKISLELHFNESTVWEREKSIYSYIYQCLDDESLSHADEGKSGTAYQNKKKKKTRETPKQIQE